MGFELFVRVGVLRTLGARFITFALSSKALVAQRCVAANWSLIPVPTRLTRLGRDHGPFASMRTLCEAVRRSRSHGGI